MIKPSTRARSLAMLAVVAIVSACTSSPAASGGGGSSAGTKQYTIGYSNGGGVGNGFREEQVCTAKAEAKTSGQVSNLTVIHRNTDAAGQLADIRSLIAKGVNAIVFNPNDPNALNPALAEAHVGRLGRARVPCRVEQRPAIAARRPHRDGNRPPVDGERVLAGHPADSDRDKGFQNVLKQYPNIKVVPNNQGVFTGWDPAKATQITNDFISSGGYDHIDGIWASGMGKQIVDAIKAANKPFKPIADADIGGFVNQLLDPTNFPGLKGAAVTNTASVGGAGITLALKLLNGEQVQADPNAGRPNTVLLDPVLVDNLTAASKAQLKAWISVPGMDPLWPLSLSIKGWTTYDANTVPSSCKGA